MFKLKLGSKEELVISKKIMERLGFSRDNSITLEIKGDTEYIRTSTNDIVERWEERAKRCGEDVSKWIYGDRLYEEEFQ